MLAAAALLAVAVAPTAAGNHDCDDTVGAGCVCPAPTLSTGAGPLGVDKLPGTGAEVAIRTPRATYYVLNDVVNEDGWLASPWIYMEANGVGGLQRHDDYCYHRGYNADHASDFVVF